ncbi:NYN domain-containing protein [Petroclostridium sp. X23]|jgi:predicted RNA-binding protein with PIN domain|uniref:NYN domain-containing protein n=1 Tax=Petroclostridium sp. X23 TaxID=3045146 RepID=UPI0024AD88B2|nr:NYN domain-containing protein [Petroclostridium sp. X23]WHH61417.1 NYN domain-containing protein [Petroclostridium sp. X23]
MEYLIIDGYNIINAWPELAKLARDNLENARWKLLEILADYQGYKKNKVIVVFDAHLVKGSIEKKDIYAGVDVVYTKENETADNYIEKLVHDIGRSETVRVATSDFLEQTIILSKGATRLSANELKEEVKVSHKDMDHKYLQRGIKDHTIGSRLGEDTLRVLEKLRRQKF